MSALTAMHRKSDEDLPRALFATTDFCTKVCIGGNIIFGLRDYLLGSKLSAGVVWASAGVIFVAALLLRRRKDHRLPAHILITSQWAMLSTVHLWDGQLHSMSLWTMSLVPLIAAVTLGKRETLLYGALSILSVIAVTALGDYIQVEQLVAPTPDNWLALRFLILLVFAGTSANIVHGSNLQITILEENRDQLRKAKGQIEGAIQAKSRFFSGLARELQSPMQEIARTTRFLDGLSLSEQAKAQLAPLVASSSRLDALLRRMLEISQLESDGVDKEPQPFFFQEMLQSLCSEHLPQARARGTQLALRSSDQDIRCVGDPALIRRVLDLLVTNAINSPQQERIEISMRQRELPQGASLPRRIEIEIEIKDGGAARMAKQLAAGFQDIDQFGKVVAGAESESGLLYTLAQRITEHIDAELCFEEKRAPGTSVTLRVALLADHSTAQDPNGEDGVDTRPQITLRNILNKAARWTPLHPCADSLTRNSTLARLAFYRLAHFQYSMLTFCLIYSGVYFARGANDWAWVAAGSAAFIAVAIRLLDRSCRISISFWMTFAAGFVTMFNTTLHEGGLISPSLWFIPIGPLMAAYILNLRATAICTAIAAVSLCSIPGLLELFSIPQAQIVSPFAICTIRITNIALFAGMSLLWLNVMEHQVIKLDRRNRELAQANDLAKKSQQERSVFCTNMSHEIRTPLHGIVGPAQILLQQELPPSAKEALDKIYNQAKTLARMVGCMLDQDPKRSRSRRSQPTRYLVAANGAPAPALTGNKVLIVDDVAINRSIAAAHLRRFGCQITQANDGEQALDKAYAGAFDIILMDLRMPRMDGFEATRRIRATDNPNRTTPIIAVTAEAYDEQKEQCFEAGMNAHLAKPFSAQALQNIICSQLHPHLRLSMEAFPPASKVA